MGGAQHAPPKTSPTHFHSAHAQLSSESSDWCGVNMGKSASKDLKTHDSSASYLNADEEVIEEVPTLHAGPIHSLCVVDEDHFASGGVDKVSSRWAWGVRGSVSMSVINSSAQPCR